MTLIEIEEFFPYSYHPKMRYGGGNPPHPLLDSLLRAGVERYAATLHEFSAYSADFMQIGVDFDNHKPLRPHWRNGFFTGLDGVALYGMLATRRPKIFLEIGSGNSTKFAALAKAMHSPETSIVSIDPEPRAGIDKVCDVVIRQPLQECDLTHFQTLQAGDILFMDGSHRVFQNSDVSVFFLEILPALSAGVIVHVHDVFLPLDYPTGFSKRMYSEQYMLAVYLMWAGDRVEVLLPNAFISDCTQLAYILDNVWNALHLAGIEGAGSSFWFIVR